MKTIYVIFKSDRNDYYAGNEDMFAVASESQAKEIVKKLNQLQEFNNSFAENELTSYQNKYKEKYPRPIQPTKPIYQGHSSIEEQRINQKLHMQKIAEWHKLYSVYNKEMSAYNQTSNLDLMEWLDQNYIVPIELKDIEQYMECSAPMSGWCRRNYYIDYMEIPLYEQEEVG
jgi:hypothetical protein